MKRLFLLVLLTTASAQAADLYKTWKDLSNRRDVAALKALVTGAAVAVAGSYSVTYLKSAGKEFGKDPRNNEKTFQHAVVFGALAYSSAKIGLELFWPNFCQALKI